MNIKDASKIIIIGGPGTGKSTLTRNLSKELNIPYYHIDSIHHLKNWEQRDTDERDKIILDIIKKDKWIIDGTYKSTLRNRVEASDLVIFLNYSRYARIKGIMSRYLKNKGKEKSDIPGCKEKMSLEFLKFTFVWEKTKGHIIYDVLKENREKEIYTFKNRKQLNIWYKKEFKQKIKLIEYK